MARQTDLGICIRKIIIAGSFLFCVFISASLNAQSFKESISTISPVNAEKQDATSSMHADFPGIVAPFSPFQQSPLGQNQEFSPVLYGPGGNPIGGLPLTDNVPLLFGAVLCYCAYKAIRRKKRGEISSFQK